MAGDAEPGVLPSGAVTFLFTDIEGQLGGGSPTGGDAGCPGETTMRCCGRPLTLIVGSVQAPATGCAQCSPHPGRRYRCRGRSQRALELPVRMGFRPAGRGARRRLFQGGAQPCCKGDGSRSR